MKVKASGVPGPFVGPDAEAIVRQMRDMQWNAPSRKRDWMVEAAERAEQVSGVRVRADEGASMFLRDLERAGLINVLADEPA
jgi:hypothetical protein